jgi:SAM-dependent methyltransferase
MPLPNYCAWCGRHTELTYSPGEKPVLCSPCVDSWTASRASSRQQEYVLDACCGEGGAARGYAQGGHYVVGIDSNPDCRKGYLRSGAAEFICGDALKYLADEKFMRRFSFVHFSPPCQFASAMTSCRPGLRETYPNLITPGRPLLNRTYLPYVIENVGAARPWLKDPVTLCMWMFGRETYRHRLIEAGGGFTLQPPPVPEPLPSEVPPSVSHWAWEPPSESHVRARRIRRNSECGWPHPVPTQRAGHWKPGYFVSVAGHERKEPVRRVMEIDEDWMPDREAVAEAIPPYLAGYIADQLGAWRLEQAA